MGTMSVKKDASKPSTERGREMWREGVSVLVKCWYAQLYKVACQASMTKAEVPAVLLVKRFLE